MQTSKNIYLPEIVREEIKALTTHYPEAQAALLPALHLLQDRYGYISDQAMVDVADLLDLSPAEVMGTLTFYTMFRRAPSGRFHINLCKNLSCTLTGSREILDHLVKRLGIRPGETTRDDLFTLGQVECLGACTEAPVMEIDGEYFFRLTPEKVDRILDDYRGRAGLNPSDGEE